MYGPKTHLALSCVAAINDDAFCVKYYNSQIRSVANIIKGFSSSCWLFASGTQYVNRILQDAALPSITQLHFGDSVQ
jgi:hypothetical protein